MDRSTPTGVEDDALLRAVQRGDRRAFRWLYERYSGMVFRTAFRLLGHRMEAEDVTQDVFVSIYRQIDTFDARSSFKTWCYRVTVNACYDRMRKQKRRSVYQGGYLEDAPSSALIPGTSASEASTEELLRGDVQRHVERALATLNPDLRTTLVLKEIEGFSYREIADLLDCSQGTVASRLARARRHVARYLQEVGIDAAYLG